MSQEPSPESEKEPTARETLEDLARSGMYVFHGSPQSDIEEFEPRQAHSYDYEARINNPDGKPAVFASDRVDMPIFMALFNRNNSANTGDVLSGMGIHTEEGLQTTSFTATRNILEGVKQPGVRGAVYVFDREQFQAREPGSSEWISTQPVRPVRMITVRLRDFPEHVTEIGLDGKPV